LDAGDSRESDEPERDDSGEEVQDDMDDGKRHSIKRAYAALALSPELDLGGNYEVLHYLDDLNLWSALGSRRSLGLDVPMRVLAKGFSFSPMY
jgi:hypothetical protein